MSTDAIPSPYPANTVPNVRRANVVAANSPPHKFLEGKKDEELHWTENEIAARDLLFVRNCSNLTLTISSPFAKLLIGP